MKSEYDFENAEGGKPQGRPARLAVYLEAGVRDHLTACAKAKGVPVSDLVNDLLKRDIELAVVPELSVSPVRCPAPFVP